MAKFDRDGNLHPVGFLRVDGEGRSTPSLVRREGIHMGKDWNYMPDAGKP